MIAAVDRLTELGRVEHSTIAGIAAVYLPEYYEAETAIAARIRAMAQHPPAPLPDAERVLQGIEAIAGITYAERQRDAIRMAAERRIMILTGGPGTGKTTVLSGILTLFSKLGRKTLLAAPTGRAAKRLSELTGRDAATVHRLLEAQVSPENGEMFFARRREKLSGGSCFREGDRVMQIRNHYDLPWKRANGSSGTGVFNGDIGTIVSIDPKEDQIHVLFDDREVVYEPELLSELELAYAITAHKSQGSEYRAVIFAIGGGAPMLLTRGVLYTAITRARELLLLVGNEELIAQMTQNNRRNKRYSGLRFRLQGEA